MKIKDLIQKLLEFQMDDYVRVELVSGNDRTTVDVDDIVRINDDGHPHVGMLVRGGGPTVRAEVTYTEGEGWRISAQ